MIWFLSILAGLLFLIILLLWLPLQIEIATEKEIYEAKWSGLLRFRAVPADEKWRWFIRVLFWEMELGRDQARVETERKPEPQKTKKKKKGSFSIQQGIQIARGMLSAIRVKRFRIDWDSDDYVVNAWLYPLFHHHQPGQIQGPHQFPRSPGGLNPAASKAPSFGMGFFAVIFSY
ncbi:MAG: hypothetical protein H6562_17300 [Lewinellaceae bacterium]|nr:hypothetical protein [Lewinellaceae bacterium]